MEPSKRIGDYEVLAEIGRGGMGKVFRVRNVLSDRIDAMKVLLPDLVESQELAARFLREIKVLAALNHPHIAALRTALTADNQLVMIMEYVEGQSLAQRLRHGAIPTPQAIAYIDQVLDALDYAHKQHVVHRDIKPANMMVTPAGVVKLMDFGIARREGRSDADRGGHHHRDRSGTCRPNRCTASRPMDGRTSIPSGISLYEMVTGERPFKSNSDFAVMLAQVNEQPRPPIELLPALSPDAERDHPQGDCQGSRRAVSVGRRIPAGAAYAAGHRQRRGVEHGNHHLAAGRPRGRRRSGSSNGGTHHVERRDRIEPDEPDARCENAVGAAAGRGARR